MSWVEKVKGSFVIRTGDGTEFTLDAWLNPSKNISYNTKQFNFPGVEGTLVDRRERKGTQYNLEVYFTGDDHIDKATEFEVAARDKRYWTILHPIYGALFVQPISLSFDNTKQNVTKITGTVIETITDINPRAILIPEDKIEEDVEFLNDVVVENFSADIEMENSDITATSNLNEANYNSTADKIENNEEGEGYFNLFQEAENATRNATTDVNQYIRTNLAYIEAPARFSQSLDSRLDMLKTNFENLNGQVQNIIDGNILNQKRIYESLGGGILSSMALTTALPFDELDYENRTKVTSVIDTLLSSFSTYLVNLDDMQVGSGGDLDDYIPTAEPLQDLNQLMYFTMGNLFTIALESKQERTYTTTEDTDWINLTHLIYGFKNGDESMNELMRNNNLGLKGILGIEKGTEIVYYI